MSPTPAIWIDGRPAGALPLPDRGFDFGDGLFETLLLQQGVPLFPDLHLQRLQQGLQTLGFPDCLQAAREQLALAAAALAHWPWASMRLSVTRGSGPRGYRPPARVEPRIVIAASPVERDCASMAEPAVLGRATLAWASQPALAGIKHLNRLEQVMVAAQVAAAGVDEALVCDQQGRPVSVGAGNLFVYTGAELLTAPLLDCGIAGTRRRLVMERWAPAIGLAVVETPLDVATVEAAEELFYCNSLQGLRPVAALGACRWDQHPVCTRLHREYRAELSC